MPTRANRDTNSYGMKVGNGAQAPHTEIEDRVCLNIDADVRGPKMHLCSQSTGIDLISGSTLISESAVISEHPR